MTTLSILETQSSYMEDHTFCDMPERAVELGYSTFVTSGIEDFIKKEMNKKPDCVRSYDVLSEVTLVTNDGASISCEALVYVGVIPGYIELRKNNGTEKWVNKVGLFVKLNTEDTTSINMDDVKSIKYKNYVFKSNAHTMKYNTEDSTNGMHNFTYFIIDSIEEDTIMSNLSLASAYVGYIKDLCQNAVSTSSKSGKVLSKLNTGLYIITKAQFDNMYKHLDPSKYNINLLVSSIDRVEHDIMTDTDNKIYNTWRIWFKQNIIYNGMIEVSESGMYRKKLNGKWRNIPEQGDHLKIKINLWNVRVTLERLIGIAVDVYNDSVLNTYENMVANVKSGLGSCSLCRDLAIKQVIMHNDIEWCSNFQNLEHGRYIRSIIKATGKIYSISTYDSTFYTLIKSFRDKVAFRKFVSTYLKENNVTCLSSSQFIDTHKI